MCACLYACIYVCMLHYYTTLHYRHYTPLHHFSTISHYQHYTTTIVSLYCNDSSRFHTLTYKHTHTLTHSHISTHTHLRTHMNTHTHTSLPCLVRVWRSFIFTTQSIYYFAYYWSIFIFRIFQLQFPGGLCGLYSSFKYNTIYGLVLWW